MGVFKTALDVSSGMKLASELGGLKVRLDKSVQGIVELAQEYHNFRTRLGNDVDDVAIADERLTAAIAEAKTLIDTLEAAPKAVFAKVIEGLGFKAI